MYLLHTMNNNCFGNTEILTLTVYLCIIEMLLYGDGKYHHVDNDKQNMFYFGTNSNNLSVLHFPKWIKLLLLGFCSQLYAWLNQRTKGAQKVCVAGEMYLSSIGQLDSYLCYYYRVKGTHPASLGTYCSLTDEKVLESPALPTGITSAPSNCNHLISLQLLPWAHSLLCITLLAI